MQQVTRNRDTIIDRIRNSKYGVDIIPKGILDAVRKGGINTYVVNDGSSCYFHVGGGIIVVSIEQALLYCNSYDLNLDQAIESIICHELGHHLMFLSDIPQPEKPYVERLAWLLGRQFLHLTSVPSNIYTYLTVYIN